ncbi:hypothetical protein [Deinococcus yavapaiensis]|uniref:hypothetical protein n=1 Tax=Deinococcus yavapaiensis TaxID=309889 RepID=UPI001B87AAA9|nr:hypothetical protein [Deinococcus yavapaiensis]
MLDEIVRHLSGLERLRVMLETDRRRGMGESLDIRLVDVDDGRVVSEPCTCTIR